jgi:hypothetical protein
MSLTLHIVFGEAGTANLREALTLLGRADRVIAFPDDLSFGPIVPSDAASRAQWISKELIDDGWNEIVPYVEQFWREALADGPRHVVWFSRRVARDYTGFLEYLRRVGERPCDLVDLTEALIARRDQRGQAMRDRRALALGLLYAHDIVDSDLLARATPLSDDARRRYRADWDRLQQENAALRIVTPDLTLESVPITHFDVELLKHVEGRFLKSARVIGAVLAQFWDADIFNLSDFFLARRLLTLARAGVIESRGDLTRIRFSEVRLPQADGR